MSDLKMSKEGDKRSLEDLTDEELLAHLKDVTGYAVERKVIKKAEPSPPPIYAHCQDCGREYTEKQFHELDACPCGNLTLKRGPSRD